MKLRKPEPTEYFIKFQFMRELDKSIMVKKYKPKTKKREAINKVLFIAKKVIIEQREWIKEIITQDGELIEKKMVEYLLPKWYCDAALGFYS